MRNHLVSGVATALLALSAYVVGLVVSLLCAWLWPR